MAKRTRRLRPSAKRRRQAAVEPEPDLSELITEALDSGEPLPLLGLASALLSALDPRGRDPFESADDQPSREEMVESLLAAPLPETSAMLAAIAALSGDDVLRRRVRKEVADRAHALPVWLTEIHRATSGDAAAEIVDPFGDAANTMVTATLPGGFPLTAVVLIDHNAGSVVKDAFVLPDTLDVIRDHALDAARDLDLVPLPLAPADARSRIEAAVGYGDFIFPRFETETWPACRPLVEWIAGQQPAGGTGYQRPEWDDDAVDDLARRFRASPFATVADPSDLLSTVLWFGTEYGPGDPLRWSPAAAEVLLLDFLPRKVVGGVAELEHAPDLLRAFVRFCDHERGLRPDLTELTLEAIEDVETEYQRIIRSDRPQGPAALLAGLGIGHGADDLAEIVLEDLREEVGGAAALDRLDAEPLPDEPFAWDAVPADVHDRVREVLELVDRCCDALFDVEFRTACRRLLADAAAGEPQVFRRRARADTTAAAVCWIVGKANDVFGYRAGRPAPATAMPAKELAAHFGLGSASGRSGPLLQAIGINPHHQGEGMALGTPRYLTGRHRAALLDQRDRFRAAAE